MNKKYRTFFGFQIEPFTNDLSIKDIIETTQVKATGMRFNYAVDLGAVLVLTGEVGSGKSTALRYVTSQLHPSEYRTFYITASTGSILELYRMFLNELGMEATGFSRALMVKQIKKTILDLVRGKKLKLVLVIDEASLLRLEVFLELHTLCQFEMDSKPFLPIVLAGQSSLVDKLSYHGCLPFASRVVARSHLKAVDRQGLEEYLNHHLNVAGIDIPLFDDTAITAIYQGAGGLFRKTNHLARGALIAAAKRQSQIVHSEHVRLATTEIF